jgi:hypothetical protein
VITVANEMIVVNKKLISFHEFCHFGIYKRVLCNEICCSLQHQCINYT